MPGELAGREYPKTLSAKYKPKPNPVALHHILTHRAILGQSECVLAVRHCMRQWSVDKSRTRQVAEVEVRSGNGWQHVAGGRVCCDARGCYGCAHGRRQLPRL